MSHSSFKAHHFLVRVDVGRVFPRQNLKATYIEADSQYLFQQGLGEGERE